MKQLFEEYGGIMIAALAVILVLSLLFVRLDIIGVLRTVADIDTDVAHQQGQGALYDVVNRTKPVAVFTGVDLHIYKNQVFQPLKGVVFKDAEGGNADVVITSILYCNADGVSTELIGFYNSAEDIVVLNPGHYSDAHGPCAETEFSIGDTGALLIGDGGEQNLPGLVTVTYKATDRERQVTVEKLTFVIDGKEVQGTDEG